MAERVVDWRGGRILLCATGKWLEREKESEWIPEKGNIVFRPEASARPPPGAVSFKADGGDAVVVTGDEKGEEGRK